MKTFVPIVCLVLTGLSAAPAAQFQIGAHNFTLPDGFEIELVAGTNLAPRPIEADFDELGRLYVTDSSGSNDKPDKQLIDKPHRIVRLEDTDGDGRFDKQIVFADKMSFLEGCMWLDGSLYVAAPPSIWKLTDTNNDGIADVREEWFKGKTLTGCANDLHGPYAGPDGWIYWCKGAFAKQTYTLPNGKEFTTRASHIFRARPDGTGVEPIMTGGMDNPVGLAWSPEGELFLSGTFFQHPAGGKRDGLIHVLYGGVYGKDHDVLAGHPRTGDLLPMMTHLGPAAPCGLMRYESWWAFGEEFENNLFACNFNLHKITRHILKPSGATYRTVDSDFLVSDNTDFHPTDILEDADGSLLVVDTGGWYKLCCPTSQLYKPDVLGGIYRVRRKLVSKIADPRGLKIPWASLEPAELVKLLDDNRSPVIHRAVHELAGRKAAAIPALRQAMKANAEPVRRNAVWALNRIDGREAREALENMFASGGNSGLQRDDSSARAAIYSIGLWRDKDTVEDRIGKMWSTEIALFDAGAGFPPTRRATATALGRSGSQPVAVPRLLRMAEAEPLDRALEHSITYALIELNDPVRTATGLASTNSGAKRIALFALDQMPAGGLKAEQVTPLLVSTDTRLREAALWVIDQHPEWGDEMARWVESKFALISSNAEQPLFGDILTRGAGRPEAQQAIARLANRPASQATALGVMARSRLTEVPTPWGEVVRTNLESDREEQQRRAIAAASAFAGAKKNPVDLTEPLLAFGRNPSHRKDLRLSALAALPRGLGAPDAETFELLRAGLTPANSVAERGAAAGVLAKARLNESQLLALAEDLKFVGPIETPKLLAAFSRATNENVGFALVASLEKSKSLASLRADTVKPHLTNFPATVQLKADALLASLNTDAAQQKQHIDEMLASVKGGDIRRGQALFNSPKAACSACHAIGYLGGNVGPDLTKIGQIRNERDLLEAIVYPSASFVRSYEPMIVATKGGEEYSGVLKKDSTDEVVLATGPNTEQRLARADITDMRPGTVSVMPSGLAEQLTKEEVADLLAFLKATRW